MNKKLVEGLAKMSKKAVELHLFGAVTTSYYFDSFNFQSEEELIRFFVDEHSDSSLNLLLNSISSVDDNYFDDNNQELIIHAKGLDMQICTC